MRWHFRAAGLVAPLIILVGIFVFPSVAPVSAAGAAPAAPEQSAAMAAPALPATFIRQKIVLPQTSIDGPALSSTFGTFEGVTERHSVIAWTGTDTAHHLNVMTSTDGLHFGNKRILNQTSPFRPDVTQMSGPAGGDITVAWTGTDSNHSLNVLFNVYSTSPKKLTLWHENSFTVPAILWRGSGLLLAWTGTDSNHSLNVLPITLTASGLIPGKKTILWQFSSDAGPHLSVRQGSGVVLNWTSRTHHLRLATSADDIHFSSVATLADTSESAPHTTFATGGPAAADWIGWTGMYPDTAHHLNLQFTFSFPQFSGNKTVLNETALGGPALASTDVMLQIAWTGTDSAHHLNIAQYLLQ